MKVTSARNDYYLRTAEHWEKDPRSAEPRLFCRVELESDSEATGRPTNSICEVLPGWDELIDEGYDPLGSPLGPVYWRIVRRGQDEIYLSTFPVLREKVFEQWGTEAVVYCDPQTGIAFARLETAGSKPKTTDH